ncbi:MAG: propanediol dehydratase [Rothia sp.]|uniref:propanediol dehydratase n=1 Tax=Rothia sp. (in: high G+C Gram-positive bacteria) TaxID=1885016 RepID=UPI001CB320B3|nr:propanediol dehydratase [Rothia sp. (in: high G+C Gram-positive bacteria)]MBF1681098.1 propanediol dehydratase [Rothia sp. (in: high G+C Gram-positive bacteria)]
MFSTQRTARGAALVASAALGLGGSVAPATLAPATFASAAHAQTQQSPKPELPIAVATDVVSHNITLDLVAQSKDYTLLSLTGVTSLENLKVRLVAISVDDGPVAAMTVPASQMTASLNDEGALEVSIHQRLNVEQPYMVEVLDLRTKDTVSVEFMPEHGVTVDEILASRQNIFFPDTPGVPRANRVEANPAPEVSLSPSASPSTAKDSPRPTVAPAPSVAPSASQSVSARPSASASASASANASASASVNDAAPAEVTEDRLLVHSRSDQAPAETREATLEISTAELRGSDELQPISVRARNVAESGLGYDVMVFEMPADGGAVGSPLATTHVSPQQVTDASFSADLKVPGTSLHAGKRYRVVVVGGNSTEELQLMATSAFGVSVIQRAVSVDRAPKPTNTVVHPQVPMISDANQRVSPSAPSGRVNAVDSSDASADAQDLVTDSVAKIPSVDSALGYIAQAQQSARAITAQARSSVAETAVVPSTMVMSGYAVMLPGRTVVNLLGYQSPEGETVTVASPQENVGAAGSGSFYTRSSKSRGDSAGSKLEASAQDNGPLPEGTLPLSIALLGSVAFVGTAVAVNVYRRRLEGAEELGAE